MLSEAFESHRVPFACYLKHWSEPQPSTCTLFATFESHMRSTFDLRAVHIVTSCIYMPLVYLVYLSTSHSDSLHYSSFAYDWRITNTVSIHITYIVLIAYLYNTYVLFIYIYTLLYIYTHVQHRKPPEPPYPTTGGRRQQHTVPNPLYLYCTTWKYIATNPKLQIYLYIWYIFHV